MDAISATGVARLLFWGSVPLTLFGPKKWALCTWMIATNLDGSGYPFATASSVGWANFAKGLLVPVALLFRLREAQSRVFQTFPGRLWSAFIFYVGTAVLWSPFPLPGLKCLGYLIGISLAVSIFEKAGRQNFLDGPFLTAVVAGSLGLAILQTVVWGDYSYEPLAPQPRLTSFVGAQQFAALLVALLAGVLSLSAICQGTRRLLSAVLLLACYLNGSRTWFIGAIVVVLAHSLRPPYVAKLRALFAATFILLVIVLIDGGGLLGHKKSALLTDNRISATVQAILGANLSVTRLGLGTYEFRLGLYSSVLDRILARDSLTFAFGTGSASGGILARWHPQAASSEYLDYNRVFHNEWLRVLYEWGLVGLVIWSASIGSMIVGLLSLVRRHRLVNAVPAVSYLPALLLALSTENILAGAGNPVNIGFAFLLGLLWQRFLDHTGVEKSCWTPRSRS